MQQVNQHIQIVANLESYMSFKSKHIYFFFFEEFFSANQQDNNAHLQCQFHILQQYV